MLRLADGVDTAGTTTSLDWAASDAVLPGRPDRARAVSGRYGQRSVNMPAIALTALIHVVLLAALLHIRHEVTRKREMELTVVNLSMPKPPPPASEAPPPKSVVSVPAPIVLLPRKAEPISVSEPDPAPAPIAPVSVATAPAPPAVSSTVQSNDLGTRMVSGAPPRYPMESRRHKEQGTVVLALILDVDGSVASISISHSSGYARLDDAALRAVRKWRWAPTLRSGQPVKVQGKVEIPFVLQG